MPCQLRLSRRALNKKGFTLIELLIVIAIILILIAIALPNFLAAQVRAKVARVSEDLRSVSIALEQYQIDWRKYPTMIVPGFAGGIAPLAGSDLKWWYVPDTLSTPAKYITDANLQCPFGGNYARAGDFPDEIWKRYGYENIQELMDKSGPFPILANRYRPQAIVWSGPWRLQCVGPDREWNPSVAYNPTNGLVTRGDILRTQKSHLGNVNFDSSAF
jgi:prepilin-type N-terminal cleavage/methylation domain-containing protein